MTRIAFRCDASIAIGSGHVARCMALAHALRARGATVELVSRALPERVRQLLVEPQGVHVHNLASAPSPGELTDEGEALGHADWLPVSQKLDAHQSVEVLRTQPRVEWLIVDHYALDARWERAVRPHVERVLVMDDLADRDHVCDALLDQNFFVDAQTRYEQRVPSPAKLILGPKFALLRDEFAEARDRLPPRTGRLERIFVCFGGFDGAQQTLRALQALEESALPGVQVDVVIASDHADRARIEKHCSTHRDWKLHLDATTMADLMAAADLAIGASGVMNWERASLCLPAIVASVAENQHIVARDLAADRACIYLGRSDDWRAETLAGMLRGLKGTPSLLAAIAARAGALADGHGARRVAAALIPEAISLRPATPADCDALHTWRNAEETRRYSTSTAAIAIEDHRRWFERVLKDEHVALLVGEHAGRPVGVLRYDIERDEATVSIYMVPGEAGRGLGTALLRAGTQWLRTHRAGVRRVHALIRRDNARSLEAFGNAGYRLASHTYMLELAP
ncbi:MAG: UDP-2,4-diacetamido-2,4,6-trideoxy-beta-L-altropyranose hydrolase [Burkholderiales bacterium]